MVSRVIKKTPKRSVKRCFRGRSTSTPVKYASSVDPASASLAAAIHDSFFTCRRRLAKIFSKLARISTPTSKIRRATPKSNNKRSISPRRGLRFKFSKLIEARTKTANCNDEFEALISNESLNNMLSDYRDSVRKPLFFGLPPLPKSVKGTIFLDLDETLIHSTPDPAPERYDFIVRPVIDGQAMNFYVLKRPGVDELLSFLSKRFEIVVFTAGLREYAKLVVDELDKDGLISDRFYRDSCKEMDGKYVKDLSEMGRDLGKVMIVDDNPGSYIFQPDNAIQVTPFVDDVEGDRESWKLIEFFEVCGEFDDFREAIRVFAPQGWQNLEW